MILKGNCLDTLKTLPDRSVDSIVTDPPYELGFMGKSWDNSGIAYNQDLWRECLRVLKPGGHLLAFSGSRTYHRMVVAIEDAGFEIRDQIMWIYGSGFPKSLNLKDKWQGWGTALKPAHEPIVVARKPLIGTVANNVLTYGTGAINIDGSRVEGKLEGDPNRFNKTDGGTFVKFSNESPIVRTEGRWPANLIHDGSEEVLAGFPTSTSKQSAISDKRQNVGDSIFIDGIHTPENSYTDSGSAARFFKSAPIDEADTQSFIYCAKASKSERNAGLEELPERRESDRERNDGVGGDNPRNRTNEAKQNHHPTVKPLALMRYLIKLVTPPNGTVLDPFLGSGTTAVAAILEGFEWIGCEMTEDYFPIIEARVEWAENQPKTLI